MIRVLIDLKETINGNYAKNELSKSAKNIQKKIDHINHCLNGQHNKEMDQDMRL